MKTVIFCGGLGTRLSEETDIRPKPMVEIGGKPILWHIMKTYAHYGHNEFILCLGYKGYVIKEYFMNYFLHNSNLTIDTAHNTIEVHKGPTETFKVTLVETGADTKTAGRLQQVKKYIGDEDFMLTYGDGVADINIPNLLAFHRKHKKIATVTTVQIDPRFGDITITKQGKVTSFREKNKDKRSWVNAGFFVLKPSVFEYLKGNMNHGMWENTPLESLVEDGQLMGYQHHGFWKPMDALRDKVELEELWQQKKAPWKLW